MLNRSGHSLVEVLVAGMVLLAGVIPAAAAVGHSIRLGTRGRARALAAMAAETRLEQLRFEAQQSTPRCSTLSDGSQTLPDRSERWTVRAAGADRLVSVIVAVPLPGVAVTDSIGVRLSCG